MSDRKLKRRFRNVLVDIAAMNESTKPSEIMKHRIESKKSIDHIIQLIESNPYLSDFQKNWSVNYLELYD